MPDLDDLWWHGWELDRASAIDGQQRAVQLPENDLVRFTWPCELWIVRDDVVWVGLEGSDGGIVMVVMRTE